MKGPSGRTVGRYRILEEIGAGGMGVVCRAYDERLAREVALKFLPAGLLGDETARRRFRTEALALAKLNHPNIATIFDFETEGDVDFLVTEYIRGETLDVMLATGPLPEREVVRLGEQLAAGLAAAHDRGVLHRDLKPANIRVTPDGLLKILDFGIAKLLDAGSAMTTDAPFASAGPDEETSIAGTLPYMAPEQVSSGAIDGRTDVHGAGAVLYEMACGRRAFAGAGASAVMQAVLDSAPSRPSGLARISSRLEAVILKALAKDPARRHQSARELHADLQRLSVAPARRRRSRAVESIAVLPFENTTGEAEADYLSEGITDTLIHSLSALPEFKKVIARSSVYRYRGRDVSPEEVGRELDVHAVLAGRLVRHGDLLAISAELVDTADSRHLWGAQYERRHDEISGLEHEIAGDMATRLGMTVGRRKAKPGRDSAAAQAYDLCLKGRYYWNKRPAAGMVQKAIELFQQASEADPKCALAYAGLADCYNTLGAWEASALAPEVAFPQARMAAERALRLDPRLAEAQTAQAYTALHFAWNWHDADQGFERALQMNRNYVHGHHWRAHLLIASGRFDEALAESLRIIELDPFDLIVNVHLAWHYQMAHDFPKALDTATKTLDMEPNFHRGHFFAGWAYEQLGEAAKAIDALNQAVQLSGGSTVMKSALAHALARGGDHAAARQMLDELRRPAGTGYVSPYELGLVHFALGEADRGWELLERACAEHSGWMPYLRVEPRLVHLHADARFQRLLARVGLPPLSPTTRDRLSE
jgi:serine/threonine protein kinase/Tfp pilus assembly protein PilF